MHIMSCKLKSRVETFWNWGISYSVLPLSLLNWCEVGLMNHSKHSKYEAAHWSHRALWMFGWATENCAAGRQPDIQMSALLLERLCVYWFLSNGLWQLWICCCSNPQWHSDKTSFVGPYCSSPDLCVVCQFFGPWCWWIVLDTNKLELLNLDDKWWGECDIAVCWPDTCE